MRMFSIAALIAIFVVGVVSVPMASAGNPSGKRPADLPLCGACPES